MQGGLHYFRNGKDRRRIHGGNGYRNIDIVSKDAYELIHMKDTGRAKELIAKLISEGLWNEKALKKRLDEINERT